jgi:hypothetical protein
MTLADARSMVVRLSGVIATPNVRGEAGPTVLRLAREAHHVPQAPRGQGAVPLGLASTEGLGRTLLPRPIGSIHELLSDLRFSERIQTEAHLW